SLPEASGNSSALHTHAQGSQCRAAPGGRSETLLLAAHPDLACRHPLQRPSSIPHGLYFTGRPYECPKLDQSRRRGRSEGLLNLEALVRGISCRENSRPI